MKRREAREACYDSCMGDRVESTAGGHFRGILESDGRCGPIEHRLGRRLLRLVEPDSEEGRALLAGGKVELISPEGESLGTVPPEKACAPLLERLDRSIEDARGERPVTDLESLRGTLADRARSAS